MKKTVKNFLDEIEQELDRWKAIAGTISSKYVFIEIEPTLTKFQNWLEVEKAEDNGTDS